ncbi:uncharacterized protein N7483_000431 [Penicillium malachiteum]|uniref:uncharacterized protein n=1 Tax=Penicillium malachiteum TaxID=1324776 RepID=UPI002547590B|nr:uncharacterized protein N7483_000431 [Penicillium malachiteum]KAJ5735306.1 hypothetical protein N7483_000431 [Penicillium malachiteum]
MHSPLSPVAVIALLLLLLVKVDASMKKANNSISRTFTPTERYFFDVNGDPIDTSNGKLNYVNGYYVWYGQKASCPGYNNGNCGIWSWTSPDLKSWNSNGALFNSTDPINKAACTGSMGGCGRPKIVYNGQTQKHVLYSFASRLSAPGTIPVFTSDSLTSGYTFAGYSHVKGVPQNWTVEDLGLSVIDGTEYVIWTQYDYTETVGRGALAGYSSIYPPFIQTLHLQKLTPDFLNGTGTMCLWFRGTCDNCNQSIIISYRSKNPSGRFTRQIVKSSFTCGGQVDGVATVPSPNGKSGSTYLLSADAYLSPPYSSSASTQGFNVFTLSFNEDGSIKPLSCDPSIKYTVEGPEGKSDFLSGIYAEATDKAPNMGNYTAANDVPYANFYQTWVSSKPGNLTTIGIIFRYASEEKLLSPYYIWETLASVSVGLDDTLQNSLLTFKVPVGKTVKEGDLLGFTLNSGSLGQQGNAPIAYFINDESEPNHKLYAEARGHVSEEEDLSPPIKLLPGRELKWYAIVE